MGSWIRFKRNAQQQLIVVTSESLVDFSFKYHSYYATGLVKAVYSDAQRTQLKAKFTYDDRGKRLLKESYANGNTVTDRAWYLNDAAGSLVAQVRADGNGNTQRTEHPVTGAQRIGFYDRSGAGSMRYELTDHLGNVRVGLVVTNGQVIMAEAHDYYPHGMPMPGRNITSPAAGAYAYQGKENMTSTGMLDFDLRDYDAQLGRWVVCDPMMQHFSPYLAMGNNPVMGVDPTGGYSGEIPYSSSYGINSVCVDGLWMSSASAQHYLQSSGVNFDMNSGVNSSHWEHGQMVWDGLDNLKYTADGKVVSERLKAEKVGDVLPGYQYGGIEHGYTHEPGYDVYRDPRSGVKFLSEEGGVWLKSVDMTAGFMAGIGVSTSYDPMYSGSSLERAMHFSHVIVESFEKSAHHWGVEHFHPRYRGRPTGPVQYQTGTRGVGKFVKVLVPLAGVIGAVDHGFQFYDNYYAGNKEAAAIDAGQGAAYTIGLIMLAFPLTAPAGGIVIGVAGAIDFGEFVYHEYQNDTGH